MLESKTRMFALTTAHKQKSQLSENQTVMATRVLIIDDDRETTDLLRIILEPNYFDVATANSGQEGVGLVRAMHPDVIVVDLLMPEMDGLEVCRAIRQFSNTPIVVLSAYDRPGTAEQVLESGADDYQLKPMTSNLLIASLHRLARRARAEQRNNHNGHHSH
jgi:DNA-binding response OmpR family regulator